MSTHEHVRPPDIVLEVFNIRNQLWDACGQWRFLVGLFGDQEKVRAFAWAFPKGAANLIQQALRTEFALAIGRLLDPASSGKNRPNLSVERLVDRVREIDANSADSMMGDLGAIRDRAEPLLKWRDKFHAHLDHNVALQTGTVTMETVAADIIDSLLADLQQLMENIAKKLEGSSTPYKEAYEGAADELLGLVLPRYRKSRENIERLEGQM